MSNSISIDIIFNAVNKTTATMSQINKGISGMVGNMWKVNQGVEAFDKLNQTVGNISKPGVEFESGLAEMSAITGITGKDLDELGKKAREVGKSSGLGASGAIEAYKLLASNIDVSKIGMDGLNNLQAKTITLAQASGLSLADSANAMAGTINQFGLGADSANRVIQSLAAGAKYGAAEVPDLAMSMKVAGSSVASAGLSMEAGIGALETLSQMNLKGSESGTALRNVLLKMQTELGFDFKVTKLSDALKTLQGREGDAAFMAKTFGAENMAAAQYLVKNADTVNEMTDRVTDTSVATEQAAIMNNTYAHRMDVLKAKINDLSIGFFNHNKGLIQTITFTGQAAGALTAISPITGLISAGFKGAFSGIMNTAKAARLMSMAMAAGKLDTYSALITRYGAAGKMAAVGIKISTIAQGAWNAIAGFTTGTMVPLIASTWAWTAALLANPITWIVVGVAALIAGLALAWKHFDGFRGAVVGAWEGIKQFGVILWQSIINPLKQIIGGIGTVGKAIGLMFKGKFGEAAATAKEGFANIAEGAVKASPIGLAVQVASRKNEIADKAAAGYKKGKAIDTSGFMSFGKNASTGSATGKATGSATKGINGKMFDMPTQAPGVLASGKIPVVNGMPVQTYVPVAVNNADRSATLSGKSIPGTINAAQPNMNVVKAPGMISPISMQQPAGVTVPGAVKIANADKSATLPGVSIPGTVSAAAPAIPGVNIPGNLQVSSQVKPEPMTIPGTIDAQQPEAKPMDIPGNVVLNVQKIHALNFLGNLSFENPQKLSKQEATKATGNMVDLSRNITNNIHKNETLNKTDNTTNSANSAKMEVTYSPVINISSNMDAKAKDDLMTILAANKDELMKLINEEMRRDGRLKYA